MDENDLNNALEEHTKRMLRYKFAAAALTGLLASPKTWIDDVNNPIKNFNAQVRARIAWRQADAMLQEENWDTSQSLMEGID